MFRTEIIGNLGADATEKLSNGVTYTTFSVAVTEKYKKTDGTTQERVTWISCIRKGTSGVNAYLKKGTKVYVRGETKVSLYDYKGTPAIDISLNAREIELLGSRPANDATTPIEQPTIADTQNAPY